ncbi:hypothetical protein BpHYR1_026059 [Brachionus plicatilis]|uniref:Uncharacterized protein n=1 Tax=Brachionus plicatilis TaxID=10195 RepID=A0A3M7Q499_BRAPC|nr:hypothetical protein BpHYR1_026059 [Brachionus plicatilis]
MANLYALDNPRLKFKKIFSIITFLPILPIRLLTPFIKVCIDVRLISRRPFRRFGSGFYGRPSVNQFHKK